MTTIAELRKMLEAATPTEYEEAEWNSDGGLICVGEEVLGSFDDINADKAKLVVALRNLAPSLLDALAAAGEIAEYVAHDLMCILSRQNAGRPTADGGYELMFDQKWYQSRPVDETPKCQCGLSAAFARFDNATKGLKRTIKSG